MLNLSNEQLSRLALHMTGINNILLEALLTPTPPPAEVIGGETEIEIDVLVVGMDGSRPQADRPKDFNMDALCGEWKCRRQPDLMIFKASPGYLVALGKKPKEGETGDCYLLHEAGGKLCFNAGFGIVFLSYDEEKDAISLYPGGEYTRVKNDKK